MYHHVQNGVLLRVALTITLIVVLFIVWAQYGAINCPGMDPEEKTTMLIAMILPSLIILAAILLLHNLTVYTDEDSVRLKFGIGLIGKRIRFDQIESCQPVRNRWWWGWGIRKIPGGWMYNVSGLDAVELKLKKGRVFRIGTDEPQILAEVIHQRISVR